MPQVYKEPSRRVNGPAYIVGRRIWTRWANRHPIPVSRVPLEQRTGMLHVTFVAGTLTIRNNDQTDNVYPEGAHYRYDTIVSVYLEVLPRGRHDREYAEWVERPPYIGTSDRVRWIQARNTPILASREPWDFAGEGYVSTDEHLTLVSVQNIRQHLLGVLPYIGVHPSDVSTAYRYIDTLITRGRRGLRVSR